jgi:hypothetical protein
MWNYPLGTTNFDNQEARHDTVFTRLAKLIAENWRHLETTGVNVAAVIWLRNPKHFGSIFFKEPTPIQPASVSLAGCFVVLCHPRGGKLGTNVVPLFNPEKFQHVGN